MDEALIEIKNLSKIFKKQPTPALDNINAVIPKGKLIGLAGPDGAGKTTLIRLIAGLLLPTQGQITVAGHDTVKDPEAIHAITGYMPQKFGLYEDLTVQQNLNLYADLRAVPTERREKVFADLLSFTGLQPFTSRLAKDLSGGMKQKLGLACSLIGRPALLLLDEPSVGVDPISRRELWKMVGDLLKGGMSALWSSAYLDEAERCDSVLLLNEGKLLYNGPPGELTRRVEGRTFLISNITTNRRVVLEKALNQKNVIDGVIQGDNVRIVSKERTASPIDLKALDGGALTINPTPPRFEDAFVDMLGGSAGGTSLLAQNTPMTPAKGEVVIEAQGLTKRYGSFTAADNLTFKITQGQIFGFLGPNGAGKSTTFKMLCGLLKPTSGKTFVIGYDLQKAPSEARSHIGYMAQKFSLYGDLSVLQNLNFFSGIYNLTGSRQRKTVEEMIEVFDFKNYLDENANTLPLGFKQRLALSCAVMHQPQVLFLDEPTSGVDPLVRREFWNHINGLVEKGVTVMVSTHFMDEAEYCDNIALIYRGRIIHTGAPDALKELAKSEKNPSPTLEDAFIQLIETYDESHNHR